MLCRRTAGMHAGFGKIPAAPHPTSTRHGARLFSVAAVLRQIQHYDQIFGRTEGAGLIRHDLPPSDRFTAPTPADLFRTPVHEGLGTSARDPYQRTLPNQESRAPESSVLQQLAAHAPSLDEVGTLGRRWGTLKYWLGEQHPRLPLLLESFLVPNALPVSPVAVELLSQFPERVLGPLARESETDVAVLRKEWESAAADYKAAGQQHLMDRVAFEKELSDIFQRWEASELGKLARSHAEVSMAFEMLRRHVILSRNQSIKSLLMDTIICGDSFLGSGDGVWNVFFSAVEQNRAVLFGIDENGEEDDAHVAMRAAWDAIMNADSPRLPQVTGPVVIYLSLLCLLHSEKLAAGQAVGEVQSIDDGLRAGRKDVESTLSQLQLLSPKLKRQFVIQHIREYLEHPTHDLSRLLRENGLHDLSRDATLCEVAALDKGKAGAVDDEEMEAIVSTFTHANEVKTLFSMILADTNGSAKQSLERVLGVRLAGGTVDLEGVLRTVDWRQNWRFLASSLLSDDAFLSGAHAAIHTATRAKDVGRHIFSAATLRSMQNLMRKRSERNAEKTARVEALVGQLSSYELVDRSCEILKAMHVSLAPLETVANAMREKRLRPRPTVSEDLVWMALKMVAKRHPNWARANVIPEESLRSPAAACSLGPLINIFVRLAYVPQAGAAAIAQRSRRRIGPVGLEPHQHNIAVEVGFVETYDNLQYKRYDWQGWYQRMMDVQNRNVSLRCRINDMKYLDAYGKPFIDMQTERRLRVLAEERVGMSVVKLDNDKYEDQADNVTYGLTKFSELLAESRKAQLSEEYWPSVEVKVRKPSGQSKMYYSLVDYDRIEKRSAELYAIYRDAKKRSLFVTPMDMWLEVSGMQARNVRDTTDAHGYTVDSLQDTLAESEDGTGHGAP